MEKYNWKEINDRLIYALRPAVNAVGIKYIETEEQLKKIPNVRHFTKQARPCKAIGISAYYNITVAITRLNKISHHCGGNNGLVPHDEEWYAGKALATDPFKWFNGEEVSAAHVRAIEEGCPSDKYAFVTSSLAKCDIEPDVISITLLPGAAYHLLSGLIETDYQKLNFPWTGENSCADTWGYTYMTGKPGLSLGCRGDRGAGAMASDEVRITLKPGDFIKALNGVDRLKKDTITYPYWPCDVLLDF